jgi:hypothetical protein
MPIELTRLICLFAMSLFSNMMAITKNMNEILQHITLLEAPITSLGGISEARA